MRRTLPLAVLLAAGTAVAVLPAQAAPAPAPDRKQLVKAMDQALRDGAPGVLAAAGDTSGDWWASRGTADTRTGRRAVPADRFRAASLTKTFTATTVLQLVGEKRVRLDDTVERWLPGLVQGNGHDGTKVTVEQLLNHTSGIPTYTLPLFTDFEKHRYRTYTPQQLVQAGISEKPLFPPGTRWSYSNTNYVLLGLVIEKATGRTHGAEVKRRILDPLKLRDTYLAGAAPTIQGPHPRGYEGPLWGRPMGDVTELNATWAYAGGNLVSTVGDLRRFMGALAGGKLLRPELLTRMTTPWRDSSYGLGIARTKLACGVEVLWHNGMIFGYHSLLASTLDGRHTLAYNTNSMTGNKADLTLAHGLQAGAFNAEFCGGASTTRSVQLPTLG